MIESARFAATSLERSLANSLPPPPSSPRAPSLPEEIRIFERSGIVARPLGAHATTVSGFLVPLRTEDIGFARGRYVTSLGERGVTS